MINWITQKQAMDTMIVLLVAVLLFHLLVLLEIIPFTIVWAGKLNSVEEMRMMEIVSILVNAFLILVLLLRANYVRNRIRVSILNLIIWAFVILFALNTVGNLFAKSAFELYVFTSLTLVSTLLCLRIVLEKRNA